MALFDGFGRKKQARRYAMRQKWWETADELTPPEPLYDAGDVFDGEYTPDRTFDPNWVFDPLGSYTGVPGDGGEPEQDADDL